MFGFFKNKISKSEDQFVTDLAVFSSDFKYGVPSVDGNSDKLFSERALNNYMGKLPEEAEYSASDFYLDSLTGAVFELMKSGYLSLVQSTSLFREVRTFLDSNPKYNSTLAVQLMDTWESLIEDAGGGGHYYYFN